jgi:hypothetical protein
LERQIRDEETGKGRIVPAMNLWQVVQSRRRKRVEYVTLLRGCQEAASLRSCVMKVEVGRPDLLHLMNTSAIEASPIWKETSTTTITTATASG